VPKDERIIVLSMYDGIATGRFCFDSLGYKNIAYYAYELDPYAIRIAKSNFGDIIHCGDAFAVRESDWFMERAVEMWGRFYSKNS
jgi:DNA (cytosine-5)-methyltransferase 3A